ncbi:hypothetical protein [Kutzneria sp. NPDC051319]|uniref:hypothetical protein n=1 Tax=Kutzneria sp. NPDC051319 TaxID=3155047 RepID=UPI003431CD10
MTVPVDVLVTAPLPIGLLIVLLRVGPGAVLTLLAGLVALLTRNPDRAKIALTVLRLMRGPSRPTKRGRPWLAAGSSAGKKPSSQKAVDE